jgi:hypothetical protein
MRKPVEAGKQCAAADERQPARRQVGGELRRGLFENRPVRRFE